MLPQYSEKRAFSLKVSGSFVLRLYNYIYNIYIGGFKLRSSHNFNTYVNLIGRCLCFPVLYDVQTITTRHKINNSKKILAATPMPMKAEVLRGPLVSVDGPTVATAEELNPTIVEAGGLNPAIVEAGGPAVVSVFII